MFVNKSFFATLLLIVLTSVRVYGQKLDSIDIINSYKKHVVLYTDFGWSTAPMSIHYPFPDGIKKIQLRNNFKPVIGLGFAYKWLALRFNISLPVSARTKSKYGKSTYYNLGLEFGFRNMWFDVNWHSYQGFAMKDAYRWNDTITKKEDNLIRQDITTASFAINAYQFWNNDYKMQAFKGKTASYSKDVRSFYLKYVTVYHGISSPNPILPVELRDTNQTKMAATAIGSIVYGVVPGYAYVRRWKDFQFGIMGGLGLVLQGKFYTVNGVNRSALDFAPRIDFRLMAGLNRPKFFCFLYGDFDNKTIHFDKLYFIQTYYNVKLILGFRIPTSGKREQAREAKKKEREKTSTLPLFTNDSNFL
jgi:hypothetical protein